jgi:hypothetical protein
VQYRSWSSSLWSFLQSPVTSSLLVYRVDNRGTEVGLPERTRNIYLLLSVNTGHEVCISRVKLMGMQLTNGLTTGLRLRMVEIEAGSVPAHTCMACRTPILLHVLLRVCYLTTFKINVSDRWMNEYDALMEWYWQKKTEVTEKYPAPNAQNYDVVSLAQFLCRLNTYRGELHDLEYPESECQVHNHHDQQSQYQQVQASLPPAIYSHSEVVPSPMTGCVFYPIRRQGPASQHPADTRHK